MTALNIMTSVNIITPQSRVVRDPQNDVIRAWFDLSLGQVSHPPLNPRDVAYQVLKDNAKLFRWSSELLDLRDYRLLGSLYPGF